MKLFMNFLRKKKKQTYDVNPNLDELKQVSRKSLEENTKLLNKYLAHRKTLESYCDNEFSIHNSINFQTFIELLDEFYIINDELKKYKHLMVQIDKNLIFDENKEILNVLKRTISKFVDFHKTELLDFIDRRINTLKSIVNCANLEVGVIDRTDKMKKLKNNSKVAIENFKVIVDKTYNDIKKFEELQKERKNVT